MKMFISQPMNGRQESEIKGERERIKVKLIDLFGSTSNGTLEFIDAFIEDNEFVPREGNIPLWYLARFIQDLSMADVAFFAKGWKSARGCRIEHECAEQYGIMIIEEGE